MSYILRAQKNPGHPARGHRGFGSFDVKKAAKRGESHALRRVPLEEATRSGRSLTGSDNLHQRLRLARKERGLPQSAIGELLGVSQKTIALWEQGAEPDEDGNVHGKPISKELRPFVERWIEGGEEAVKADLQWRSNGNV